MEKDVVVAAGFLWRWWWEGCCNAEWAAGEGRIGGAVACGGGGAALTSFPNCHHFFSPLFLNWDFNKMENEALR